MAVADTPPVPTAHVFMDSQGSLRSLHAPPHPNRPLSPIAYQTQSLIRESPTRFHSTGSRRMKGSLETRSRTSMRSWPRLFHLAPMSASAPSKSRPRPLKRESAPPSNLRPRILIKRAPIALFVATRRRPKHSPPWRNSRVTSARSSCNFETATAPCATTSTGEGIAPHRTAGVAGNRKRSATTSCYADDSRGLDIGSVERSQSYTYLSTCQLYSRTPK